MNGWYEQIETNNNPFCVSFIPTARAVKVCPAMSIWGCGGSDFGCFAVAKDLFCFALRWIISYPTSFIKEAVLYAIYIHQSKVVLRQWRATCNFPMRWPLSLLDTCEIHMAERLRLIPQEKVAKLMQAAVQLPSPAIFSGCSTSSDTHILHPHACTYDNIYIYQTISPWILFPPKYFRWYCKPFVVGYSSLLSLIEGITSSTKLDRGGMRQGRSRGPWALRILSGAGVRWSTLRQQILMINQTLEYLSQFHPKFGGQSDEASTSGVWDLQPGQFLVPCQAWSSEGRRTSKEGLNIVGIFQT